jgi:hypothetical protein
MCHFKRHRKEQKWGFPSCGIRRRAILLSVSCFLGNIVPSPWVFLWLHEAPWRRSEPLTIGTPSQARRLESWNASQRQQIVLSVVCVLFNRAFFVSRKYARREDSSVGVVTRLRTGWRVVRLPVEARNFFSFSKCWNRLWSPGRFLFDVKRTWFPLGAQRPRLVAEHTPLSLCWCKKRLKPLHSSICIYDFHRDIFTFCRPDMTVLVRRAFSWEGW